MIKTTREKKPDEVEFGPGFPPSNMAFNYLAKYQFIVGKGIGKDLQGDPEPVPVRKCPQKQGIGFSRGPKRNQWKRINRPTHASIHTIKSVYQGVPEPYPFNGSMYPGFEIFKDVVNFSDYANAYKEVKLLEIKPKSMKPVKPIVQQEEPESDVSEVDMSIEELKKVMIENFADEKGLVGVIKEKGPEIVNLLKNLMLENKEEELTVEEDSAIEGLPLVGDDYVYDVSSILT